MPWACGICLAGGKTVPATEIVQDVESLCDLHYQQFVNGLHGCGAPKKPLLLGCGQGRAELERQLRGEGGEEEMREIDMTAVETDLTAGMTIAKVAEKLDVPSSTLRTRLLKSKANGHAAPGRTIGKADLPDAGPDADRPRQGHQRAAPTAIKNEDGGDRKSKPQNEVLIDRANRDDLAAAVVARLDRHWQALTLEKKLDLLLGFPA